MAMNCICIYIYIDPGLGPGLKGKKDFNLIDNNPCVYVIGVNSTVTYHWSKLYGHIS